MFLNRLNLRHNWPLVIAVVAFLILYLLFSSIHQQVTADFYQPEIGDKVEYTTLLSQHEKRRLEYPAILVFGASSIALITLFGVSRIPRHKAFLSIILVILTQWWAVKICGDSWANDGTILKNVQSIQFKQINYNLTLSSTLGGGGDWVEQSFLVFECDASGEICMFLESSLDGGYYSSGKLSEATLKIDPTTNVLYLQVGDEKTVIAQ